MAKIDQKWWWQSDPYSPENVEEAGKRDGEASPPIPDWHDRAHPPFQRELRRAGQMDAELIALKWVEEDQELKAKWRRAWKEREEARKKRDRLQEKRDRLRSRYEKKHGTPAPEVPHGRGWYVFLLVLWLFTELPVNGIAFQLFGKSLVFAFIGAVLVALILLPSAHYLGDLLRNTDTWSWKKILFGGALTALPIGVIAAISKLRQAYARYRAAESEAPGVEHLGDGASFWILGAINLALFGLATYVAYHRHPRWLGELRQVESDLEDARQAYQEKDKACNEAATERALAFKEKKQRVAHKREAVSRRAQRYRDRNLRTRGDRADRCSGDIQGGDDLEEGRAYPRSYAEDLDLEIPETLQDLDWSVTDGPAEEGPEDRPAASAQGASRRGESGVEEESGQEESGREEDRKAAAAPNGRASRGEGA